MDNKNYSTHANFIGGLNFCKRQPQCLLKPRNSLNLLYANMQIHMQTICLSWVLWSKYRSIFRKNPPTVFKSLIAMFLYIKHLVRNNLQRRRIVVYQRVV